MNDLFEPKIGDAGMKEYEIWIYANNGAQVFHNKDLYRGWNGCITGVGADSICPQGTYAYKINATDSCGIQHTYNGNVFLIR